MTDAGTCLSVTACLDCNREIKQFWRWDPVVSELKTARERARFDGESTEAYTRAIASHRTRVGDRWFHRCHVCAAAKWNNGVMG